VQPADVVDLIDKAWKVGGDIAICCATSGCIQCGGRNGVPENRRDLAIGAPKKNKDLALRDYQYQRRYQP
jgi:hypothetical protein